MTELSEAIDRCRAGRRAARGEQEGSLSRPSRLRRMLRWLTPNSGTLLLAAMLVLAMATGRARAQELPPDDGDADRVSPTEATDAAQARLQTQVLLGYTPKWEGAVLGVPVGLYDLSGEISAYLYPVQQAEESSGYLIVAALRVPNPVLEFSSTADSPYLAARPTAERIAQDQGPAVLDDRPLYLGPLNYGYELTPSGAQLENQAALSRRFIDLFSGAVIEVAPEQAEIPLRARVQTPGLSETSDLSAPLAYGLIGGVPDYCQFQSGGCWSGCAPTAFANVLGYWDGHGYPNLQSGGDWQQLVRDLGSYMSTNCGSTSPNNTSPGLVSYAQGKSHYFQSELAYPNPSYDLFRGEIDAGQPIVVDVFGATEYWGANHSVTGVGYQTDGSYVIVHDALGCGSNQGDHYIHFGGGYYNDIAMHPAEPDSAPPSISFTVPAENRWYDSNEALWWTISDAGFGVDFSKWGWDDNTPDNRVEDDLGYTTLSAAGQGQHTLYVQATDVAGNSTSVVSKGWFGYDTANPTVSLTTPTMDRWYTTEQTISWTISDSNSSGDYVKWAWDDSTPGNQANGSSGSISLSAAGQGRHTLYVQAWDKAGNQSPIGSAEWIGYDTLSPNAPTITSRCVVSPSQWQNSCRDPDFTWSTTDTNDSNGSGVEQYAYEWSADAGADPDDWSDVTNCDPGPIAEGTEAGQYTLTVKARDVAGNISSMASFGLWYDGSEPTGNPIIDGGAERAYSVDVLIEPNGQDSGSGLASIHLSNDGENWQTQGYTETLSWSLLPQHRTMHTVQVELEDAAGNRSRGLYGQVCLDLYPAHPSSASYRLWGSGTTAASGGLASGKYSLSHTIGQNPAGGLLTSTSYALRSGLQGIWSATPGEEMFRVYRCIQQIYLPLVMRGG